MTLEQERDKLLMEAQRKETHSAEVEKLIEQRAAAQTQREEREKRVEHLANVGLRRMFQQGLAKGWTAWQEQYYAITNWISTSSARWSMQGTITRSSLSRCAEHSSIRSIRTARVRST